MKRVMRTLRLLDRRSVVVKGNALL